MRPPWVKIWVVKIGFDIFKKHIRKISTITRSAWSKENCYIKILPTFDGRLLVRFFQFFILLLSIISCPNLLCMYSFLTYFLPLTFKYINDPSEQPWYVIAFSFDIYIGVCLSFVVPAISFIATIPDWVKLTSCWVCFALSFGQLGILVSLARLRRAEYNSVMWALFFNLLGFPVERNIDMKLKRRQKEVRREVKFERTNSIPTHIRYLSNDPQLQNSDGRMADVIQHLTLTNSTIRWLLETYYLWYLLKDQG